MEKSAPAPLEDRELLKSSTSIAKKTRVHVIFQIEFTGDIVKYDQNADSDQMKNFKEYVHDCSVSEIRKFGPQ